jgi:phosphate transport system substrate-binding protein
MGVMLQMMTACSPTATPKPSPTPLKLNIATDTYTLLLAKALTDAYVNENPGTTIELQWGNTYATLDTVRTGKAQLAMVAGVSPNANGVAWFTDIALDGLVVVINAQNPARNLSAFELREIYAGARSRWSDVGISAMRDVELGSRENNDPSRVLFEQHIMTGLPVSLNAIVLPSLDVMANFVAVQPGAIGYLPFSRAISNTKLKMLAIDGQSPSVAAIANGNYALAMPVYVAGNAEPQAELRQFISWVLSVEGQRIVQASGYAPIK